MTTEEKQKIRKIAILGSQNLPDTEKEALAITAFLNQKGIETQHGFLYDEAMYGQVKQGEFDVLIALGGDGTMLRAGHLGGPSGVPILGINLGKFGFLTEIAQAQWEEFLLRMIAGDYWLEKRMMLCAEQWRADSLLGKWDVLNEVVVSRGQIIRPRPDAAHLHHVAHHLDPELPEEAPAHRPHGHPGGRFPGRGTLQDIAQILVVILQAADQVRVSGPGSGQGPPIRL